ncbi:50S ribosomal protein L3 N(5)-glutamine methyltransferase [Halomonas denitrificans]|nr:50S ribosomal protein L3 N(5)-glutamine methyltransferase [Halomonas denitrificans]
MSTRSDQAPPPTLGEWVRKAAEAMDSAGLFFGHGTERSIDEACWMVAHQLDLSPDFDEAMFEVRVADEDRRALETLLARRIDTRRPLAYLLGEAWFAGLRFHVTPETLVPRSPLAELIVEGLQPWLDLERPLRVLEIGTGSGCIAGALAWHWPALSVDASDISAGALEVAAGNLRRLGVGDRVRLFESDVYDALGESRYDLIISNPPYVPQASMTDLPEEYRHEPARALVAGRDGLDIVRRLIAGAGDRLEPGGLLLVEVGEAAPMAAQLLADTDAIWLEFQHGGEGVFLLDRAAAVELAASGGLDRPVSIEVADRGVLERNRENEA